MLLRFPLAAIVATLLASGASAQITYDGQITEPEWTLLATDAGGPSQGFGPDNQLNAVYADIADDGSSVSLAIAGIEEVTSNNYIVVFLDTQEGGVTGGGYDRTNAPAGVNAVNTDDTFDTGFEPDYALQINCVNGPDRCFFDLYTLTSDGTGSNNFLGEEASGATNSNDLGVTLPFTNQDSETLGFEVRLESFVDVGLDRAGIQAFAMILSGSGGASRPGGGTFGFYSNQFLTSAASGQGNYGAATPLDYNSLQMDPVAYAEFDFAGRDGNGVGDDRGHWFLGAPATGLTVDTLAARDFVFPICTSGCPVTNAVRNVAVDYDPSSSGPVAPYVLASSFATPLVPGEGFAWYLLDGRRDSQRLPWTLELGGPMVTGDVTRTHSVNSDDYYLLGNPFPQPVDPAEFTAAGGAIADAFYVYQSWSGYDARSISAGDLLLEMEGAFFGIVDTGSPASISWTIPQSARTTDVIVLSKDGAASRAELRLLAEHAGEMSPVAEVALSHAPEAAAPAPAWAPDGSPLAARMTLGTERRAGLGQAHVGAEGARFALDVEAASGRYALALDGALAGQTVRLHDRATGQTTALVAGTSYAFEGNPAGRFALEVVVDGEDAAPVVAVGGVHPNPASGDAHVLVDAEGAVRVEVLDLLGRRVSLAFEGEVSGPQAVALSTAALAPGAYLVRVTGEAFAETRRLTVAR